MRPPWPCVSLLALLACHGPDPDAPAASQNHVVIAQAASSSAAPARPAPPRIQPSDATDSVVARLRDPRLRRAPRATALLVTEVSQIEMLLGVTSPGASDRPSMLRRLAENYEELARAARGEHTIAVAAGDEPRATRTAKIEKAATDSAARRYAEWLLAPSPPLADEVHYHLALNQERSGQMDEARKNYFQIVSTSPDSRLVPTTYLAFGEGFLAQAADDPSKFELARQAYRKAAEYPPPDNKVYGLALVRLAQIAAQLGDPAEVAAARARALDSLTYESATADKEELTRMLP